MTNLRTETLDDVLVLTLDRPQFYNALDLALARDLANVLTDASSDSRVRAIVLTGAGKAFCAGGDLRWFSEQPHGAPAAFHALAAQVDLCVIEMRRMAKPVIAAINGIAAGGGFSLALACDFRIFAEHGQLRQGYTSSGLCIDAGGTLTLPRIVGLARALEIAAFDEPIDATRALAWGLATRVVSSASLRDDSIAVARDLASRSVNAFGRAKTLLMDGFDTPLEAQLEAERRALVECAAHPDGLEGITAFLEKRRPDFRAARKNPSS